MSAFISHFISIFSQRFYPFVSKKSSSEAKGMFFLWCESQMWHLSLELLALQASFLTRKWKASWFHSLLEQVGERFCRARGSNVPKRPAYEQLVRLEWQYASYRAAPQPLSPCHLRLNIRGWGRRKSRLGVWGLESPQDSNTCGEKDQFSEDSNKRNELHTCGIQRSYFRKVTS